MAFVLLFPSIMDSIQYDKLPFIAFPKGTYMVVHYGIVPSNGFVLSDVKIVQGWPNPLLEAARKESPPIQWLTTIDKLAFSNERPEFNMGVYQVGKKNYPAAIYGPFEKAHPVQLIQLQNTHLSAIPENMKHLAHLF